MADPTGQQFATSLPPSALSFSTHQIAHPNESAPPPTLSQHATAASAAVAAVPPSISRVPYPTSTLRSSFEAPSRPAAGAPGAATATTAAAASPSSSSNQPTPAAVSAPAKRKRTFKVIIVGDAGVGKTCLSFRFCNGRFPEYTEATIGVDFRERSVTLEGETLKVQLWDTAGQERYRQSIVAHYYRNVHAVVFVYDVSDQRSFASLPAWLEECEKHGLGATTDIPRILIGNKCDLEPPANRVCTDSAQIFADRNNMALFETSAKKESEADHVESIFMTLVHHLHRSKAMHVQSERERADKKEQTLLLKAGDAASMQEEGWCC